MHRFVPRTALTYAGVAESLGVFSGVLGGAYARAYARAGHLASVEG